MTPKDFKREDFQAIMQPLPEIPPLGRSMTVEDYERLAMRLEDHIKDLEAKLLVATRLEALEEAAKIADHRAGCRGTAAKCHEVLSGDDSQRLAWGHKEAALCANGIASAIREIKGAAATE